MYAFLGADCIKEALYQGHVYSRTIAQHIWLTMKMKIGIGSLVVATLVTASHAPCPDFTSYSQVCLTMTNNGLLTCLSVLDQSRNTVNGSFGLTVHAAISCLSYFQQFGSRGVTYSVLNLHTMFRLWQIPVSEGHPRHEVPAQGS